MRLSSRLLLLGVVLCSVNALPAQTIISPLGVDDPNPADFEMAAEEPPPAFAQAPVAPPAPLLPEPRRKETVELSANAQQYRRVIEDLHKDRHTFIHCELKNGKVLTGLIRGESDRGFTLHTNALGGPFVQYEDLADAPRAVPAVGTRIKQGAQWTGLVVGVAIAIPLAVPLCLIVYPLIAAGVLQD